MNGLSLGIMILVCLVQIVLSLHLVSTGNVGEEEQLPPVQLLIHGVTELAHRPLQMAGSVIKEDGAMNPQSIRTSQSQSSGGGRQSQSQSMSIKGDQKGEQQQQQQQQQKGGQQKGGQQKGGQQKGGQQKVQQQQKHQQQQQSDDEGK